MNGNGRFFRQTVARFVLMQSKISNVHRDNQPYFTNLTWIFLPQGKAQARHLINFQSQYTVLARHLLWSHKKPSDYYFCSLHSLPSHPSDVAGWVISPGTYSRIENTTTWREKRQHRQAKRRGRSHAYPTCIKMQYNTRRCSRIHAESVAGPRLVGGSSGT